MLNFIGNVFWLLISWYVSLNYLILAILLFPLFGYLWPLVKFSFLPFGREFVSPSYLAQFKNVQSTGPNKTFSDAKGFTRFLGKIIWPILIGWYMALGHLLSALLNIMFGIIFCWTIVGAIAGLANAKVHFSMIPVAFMPFGRVIISAEVAKKLKDIKAEKEVKDITG